MYTQEIKPPKTDKQGLINALQMAINNLESGNSREAILGLVDTIDSLKSSKFSWIDPDYVPSFEPEKIEEPLQVTSQISKEQRESIILHRNYYYI